MTLTERRNIQLKQDGKKISTKLKVAEMKKNIKKENNKDYQYKGNRKCEERKKKNCMTSLEIKERERK